MSDCLIATGAAVLIALINTVGTVALAWIRAKHGIHETAYANNELKCDMLIPPQDKTNAPH